MQGIQLRNTSKTLLSQRCTLLPVHREEMAEEETKTKSVPPQDRQAGRRSKLVPQVHASLTGPCHASSTAAAVGWFH
jgi:hypothetical protein